MNFDEAIASHAQWRTRLRALVNGQGQIDPNQLNRDDECPLGKWIHGEGARYAKDPQFARLKAAHAEFHASAGKVAAHAKAGRKTEATAELNGRSYAAASMAVVTAISAIRRGVETRAA